MSRRVLNLRELKEGEWGHTPEGEVGYGLGQGVYKTLSGTVSTTGSSTGGTSRAVQLANQAAAVAAAAIPSPSPAVAGDDLVYETSWVARPKKYLTGFVNRTDSTLGMSGSNFQITTASTYDVYTAGVKHTYTTTQEVAIANDNTDHFVYFDTDGVLKVSTTVWSIEGDAAPVATVYKNGTGYAIGDERHSALRNPSWHQWAHDTIGMRYHSGLAGTFTSTTLSIAQGSAHDEDIDHDTGGTKTTCRFWRRNTGAASMQFTAGATVPANVSAGVLYWDDAGTNNDVASAKFTCSYVYMTNDITYPIYVVSGQAQHNTVAAARNDSLPAIPGITTREWKLLYRLIFQNSGGTPTYVEASDYREVSTGPGSSYTPSSHTSLTNRDAAGSHPATAISVDVTNFAGELSGTDTTVQAALDTLDDHTHPASPVGVTGEQYGSAVCTDIDAGSWTAISSGITVNTTTGAMTILTAGTYLIQFWGEANADGKYTDLQVNSSTIYTVRGDSNTGHASVLYALAEDDVVAIIEGAGAGDISDAGLVLIRIA